MLPLRFQTRPSTATALRCYGGNTRSSTQPASVLVGPESLCVLYCMYCAPAQVSRSGLSVGDVTSPMWGHPFSHGTILTPTLAKV